MKAQIQMFPLVEWEQPNQLFDNYFNQCKLLKERKTIQAEQMELYYLSHDCFRTGASDGEYDLYSSLEVWSDAKITVKDGLIDRESLNAAVREILVKSGYNGRIVESVEFDEELADGSFYTFIGS